MRPEGLVFMGSKQAGLEACRTLLDLLPAGAMKAVISPDDSSDERSVLGDIAALAGERRVPFVVVRSRLDTVQALRQYPANAAVVLGWYQLLPVTEFGHTLFLGFHYSLLPKYRGNAPLVWQIINGEQRLGVSFFELVEGMDEGRLADQRAFELARDEDVSDALLKANRLVNDMLEDFVAAWGAGKLQLRAQPEEEPTYGGMRMPGDGLIDWSAPAARIHNFIRAQARPYPGAFTRLEDGRRLIVWRAAQEKRTFFGTPGGVVEVGGGHAVVACGSGAIRLESVQVEGERETAAGEVLKSMKIRLHRRRMDWVGEL